MPVTIAAASLRRLPQYLRMVTSLAERRQRTVTTAELARQLSLDEALVRKDLAAIGFAGKPRAGYEVETLKTRLEECLDRGQTREAVFIGIGRRLVLALLILGPLLFLPPETLIQNPLDSPRRFVFQLGAWLLIALILCLWAARGRLVLRQHPLDAGVLLFLLALVVCGLGGVYPHISFLAPVWTTEGLQMLGGFVLLYFGVKEFLREPADRALAAWLLVVVGGLVAAIGLVERFVFDPSILPHLPSEMASLKFNPNFSGTRLLSTLGNPMFTGTYLAMLIPLAAGVALAATSRFRLITALVSLEVMFFALFFTLARAAWVGLAVTLPVLLAVILWRAFAPTARRQDTPNPHFRPALLALAALFVLNIVLGGVVVAAHPGLRDRFRSLADMRRDGTVQTRAVYMQTAWEMFKARPVQGWGPGNLRYVFPQYRPSSALNERDMPLNRGYTTALPHNLFLQLAAEMGVVGLLAFLLLLVLLYRTGFRLLRTDAETSWLAVGLLGMLTVYLLVNQMAFDNAATMAIFWIGLALLAGLAAADAPLTARCGKLAMPLTDRGARIVGKTGGAIIVLAALQLCSNFSGAHAVHLAHDLVNHTLDTRSLMSAILTPQQGQDIIMRPRLGGEVTRQITAAITLSPSPFFWVEQPGGSSDIGPGPRSTWSSSFRLYDELFFTYKVQRELTRTVYQRFQEEGNAEEADYWNALYEEASAKMFRTGETAIRLMDREPRVLRHLVIEYAKEKRFADGHRIANHLLKCEPLSAEARQIVAELHAEEGNLAEALHQAEVAIELDATWSESHAIAGHYAHLLAAQGGQDNTRRRQAACAHYENALALGDLKDEYRAEYTKDLVLLKRNPLAIEQGNPPSAPDTSKDEEVVPSDPFAE